MAAILYLKQMQFLNSLQMQLFIKWFCRIQIGCYKSRGICGDATSFLSKLAVIIIDKTALFVEACRNWITPSFGMNRKVNWAHENAWFSSGQYFEQILVEEPPWSLGPHWTSEKFLVVAFQCWLGVEDRRVGPKIPRKFSLRPYCH